MTTTEMVSLCIFMESGRTFTFHGVMLETNNETGLVFTYKAASDGREKRAQFFQSRIVGFSTWTQKPAKTEVTLA